MNQHQLKIISSGLEQLAVFHEKEARLARQEQIRCRDERSFEKEKHEILSLIFQGLHGCFYNAARVSD